MLSICAILLLTYPSYKHDDENTAAQKARPCPFAAKGGGGSRHPWRTQTLKRCQARRRRRRRETRSERPSMPKRVSHTPHMHMCAHVTMHTRGVHVRTQPTGSCTSSLLARCRKFSNCFPEAAKQLNLKQGMCDEHPCAVLFF